MLVVVHPRNNQTCLSTTLPYHNALIATVARPVLLLLLLLPPSLPADVEGCFGILFSLLFKTENPAAAMPRLSMEIATKVLEKIDDRAPLRLKL